MNNITIKDVARKSGYSLATVSRVLSGSDYPVSKGTREAIIKKAQELGYVSNMLARGLKTSVSFEVAIVVPDITNPFYNSLVSSAEKVFSETGYNVSVSFLHPTSKNKDILSEIRGRMIDGVLIAADCIFDDISNQINVLEESIPCIIVDYIPKSILNPNGVFFEYYPGGRLAADYLIGKGHQNIAFVSRTLNVLSRVSRCNGFTDAMYDAGGHFSRKDIFVISSEKYDFEAGRLLTDRVLDSGKGYTAIAASNDAMAVGVISRLRERNYRIPEDISVMGFDDCVFSRMSTPLLTTIRVPSEDMGAVASNMLLDYLRGKTSNNIFLDPAIVERDSVSAI